MPGLMRRESREEAAAVSGRFDRTVGKWARMVPFRLMPFPHRREAGDLIRSRDTRRTGRW